jgi:hypothetical protein
MRIRDWSRVTATGLALVATCLVLVGCGDSTGLGRRYKVSGTVTYKGTPVEKGVVTFQPENPEGRSATGTIENGSYSLTTAIEGDGALPGKYKVTITSKEADLSGAMAGVPGGSPKQDDIAKANINAKNLIPAKFSLADTSGLTAEVQESSNTFNFELTD